MKMTLLEMVVDILNDMDSDEVNSINDTSESVQVAQIIKSTYFAMMSNRNWPHQRKLLQLTPSGDNALPTHMSIEDDVKEMCFVNYNCAKLSDGTKTLYRPVKWLDQDNFLRLLNGRDNTQTNISVIIDPGSLITLHVRNDLPPTYFTSFDDRTLIFDSYDSAVDDTLQASKIQAYAYVMNDVWLPEDDFVPDLPSESFTALLEESKSRASVKLRQMPDQKAEQEAQRQQRWLSRKDWRVKGGITYPDYGRSPRGSYKGFKDPTFRRDD